MPTREELTQHLLLSYILTYNERTLREFVEDPAAVLERLGLSADSMRCPPEAHRALARADGAVREAEALGELEAVRALPMVSEIVSRHLTGPVRLRKLPFGVQFEESQTPVDDGEEGRQDMTWTATGTVECSWGFKCGSDTDG
ncbi:MAG: hypothetical protein JW990_04955 [Thermoleophilia bacterium]|nr:hypothetical protein [Thermoleophilia bacterium]